jgi:hypothetical protein
MRSRIIATALTAGAVGLGLTACGSEDTTTSTTSAASPTSATATGTTTTVSDPTASTSSVGVSGANTTAVVKAANAFLATLTDAQKNTILLTFGDTGVKTSWSNLPAALSPRKGIPLGSMTAKQQTAALALMKVVLSPQGYTELAQVREADDYLKKAAAAKGGPGSTDYSSGNYYFAFYGAPSTTKQWLLQYTGHHLTHNVSYKGNKVTFGPTFEGVEPISFAKDGKTIDAQRLLRRPAARRRQRRPVPDHASGRQGLEPLPEGPGRGHQDHPRLRRRPQQDRRRQPREVLRRQLRQDLLRLHRRVEHQDPGLLRPHRRPQGLDRDQHPARHRPLRHPLPLHLPRAGQRLRRKLERPRRMSEGPRAVAGCNLSLRGARSP